MTEAMPFLQKYDITFLRPPTIAAGDIFICGIGIWCGLSGEGFVQLGLHRVSVKDEFIGRG